MMRTSFEIDAKMQQIRTGEPTGAGLWLPAPTPCVLKIYQKFIRGGYLRPEMGMVLA